MAKIPGSEETLFELRGLLAIIWSAIDSATTEAREFFDSREKNIDRCLAPCLVRYHTKLFLTKEGQDVEEEEMVEADDYDLVNVPNNGLYLEYGKYRIRILKSDSGELPAPGISKKRQDFWSQRQTDMFEYLKNEYSEITSESRINLIVLWDVFENYGLSSLHLACPQSGGTTKESVSTHWTVSVPNPITTMTPTVGISNEGDEEDIGILLKQTIKKGGQSS